MPLTDRFDGVWSKMEWAKKHIDHLEREIVAFHDADPYHLIREDNPQTGYSAVKVGAIDPPIPTHLSLILGDAVHNLRSALDHLAYLMVPSPNNATAYPIVRKVPPSPTDISSLYGNKVPGASRKVIKALKAEEPYFGGKGQYLWTIDHLDILDKHQLILPVGASYEVRVDVGSRLRRAVGTTSDAPFKPEDIPSTWVTFIPVNKYPLAPGLALYSAPTQEFEGHDDPQFTLDIAFGKPQVLEGEPVVRTLRDLVNRTERLIESLIPLL
jgi:hypothetical protein